MSVFTLLSSIGNSVDNNSTSLCVLELTIIVKRLKCKIGAISSEQSYTANHFNAATVVSGVNDWYTLTYVRT